MVDTDLYLLMLSVNLWVTGSYSEAFVSKRICRLAVYLLMRVLDMSGLEEVKWL